MKLAHGPLALFSPDGSTAESCNDKVLSFYERFPCGGDEKSEDNRWTRLAWMPYVFRARDHEGERVLDLGCGIGIDAQRFLEGNAIVVGVDSTPTPLRTAAARLRRVRASEGWHLVRADIRALPFKTGTFDYVYSNGVLHHIRDYPRAMKEASRCLKAGKDGTILVYHERSLMTFLTIFVRMVSSRGPPGSLVRRAISRRSTNATQAGLAEVLNHPLILFFSRPVLTRKLTDSGFAVNQMEAYDWLFPLRRDSSAIAPGPLDRWLGRFLIAQVRKMGSTVEGVEAG